MNKEVLYELIEGGKYNEAEKYLLEEIVKQPDDADIRYQLASVLQRLGHFERAIFYYEQSLVGTNDVVEEIVKNKVVECQEQLNTVKKPLVSIVLLAYNKLDFTKMCVDSIFTYTSHIDFELIAVNNGSTDGTMDYFNSLPANTRPLHLPVNQGVVGGFNEGIKIARGTYTAAVCNDFIFTTRWLDNLLTCIESDEKIGYVSPGAGVISNYQRIPAAYNNVDEMQQFAEGYNKSDPLKWQERVRLLPCVLMVRTALLKELGGYDPAYYYGEFADDDISFQIRRAGYKLVFCGDTYTHHFGSITVGANQILNNSLGICREIFKNKFGLDSWDACDFQPIMLEKLDLNSTGDQIKILGINTKCGSNPLQLKNMLRLQNRLDVSIHNYYWDSKYKLDIETVSDRTVFGSLADLSNVLGDDHFYTYIILEIDLESRRNQDNLYDDLRHHLVDNGELACRISYSNISDLTILAEPQAVQLAGFEITSTQVVANVLGGQDLLLTARRREQI
ncbi:glycosyltransferase [Paenibacillus sp. GSMTC-2017]|uniref:glycosyltransferase n=1 Tax=Paenibacillus sp. GSMTC-2017 TaxID=2794350 RepID=UPI0018D8CBD5|nr:glycosyltransferase [Paenibacillus sp. GSMTC-2017]MBH5320629.1 glycosyltransferase [Paenibacillus sp. GSMTC-2017]